MLAYIGIIDVTIAIATTHNITANIRRVIHYFTIGVAVSIIVGISIS